MIGLLVGLVVGTVVGYLAGFSFGRQPAQPIRLRLPPSPSPEEIRHAQAWLAWSGEKQGLGIDA